jgi:hypothetical protein
LPQIRVDVFHSSEADPLGVQTLNPEYSNTVLTQVRESPNSIMASPLSYFRFSRSFLPACLRYEPEFILPLYTPPQSPQIKALKTTRKTSSGQGEPQPPIPMSLM